MDEGVGEEPPGLRDAGAGHETPRRREARGRRTPADESREDGEVREDGMTGLAEARVGASVQWRNDRVGVGATLRTPVWRYIVPGDEAPGEVLSPVSLALSVDWAPGR